MPRVYLAQHRPKRSFGMRAPEWRLWPPPGRSTSLPPGPPGRLVGVFFPPSLSLSLVVCCCLLLSIVVYCCLLLFIAVNSCLLLYIALIQSLSLVRFLSSNPKQPPHIPHHIEYQAFGKQFHSRDIGGTEILFRVLRKFAGRWDEWPTVLLYQYLQIRNYANI
jgi:hypothetical protein